MRFKLKMDSKFFFYDFELNHSSHAERELAMSFLDGGSIEAEDRVQKVYHHQNTQKYRQAEVLSNIGLFSLRAKMFFLGRVYEDHGIVFAEFHIPTLNDGERRPEYHSYTEYMCKLSELDELKEEDFLSRLEHKTYKLISLSSQQARGVAKVFRSYLGIMRGVC